MRSSLYRTVQILVYAAALAGVAYLAWEGRTYYATPLEERPRHELYWELKPGGTRGHAYGVAGSTLMLLMLLYSARKRLRPLRRLAPLRVWLDFHIFCGVMGPLLIVLHTSFKFGGLVAVSFWSMVAVALSGVVGRYLYLQLPRRRSGDQLSLAEVEELNARLAERLVSEFGLDEEELEKLDALAAPAVSPDLPLPLLLLRLPFEGFTLRRRVREFGRRLRPGSSAALRPLARALRQRAQLRRRILLWERLQSLFYHWHVIHKPFAIVMYLFMAIHVAVVTAAGYGWRF